MTDFNIQKPACAELLAVVAQLGGDPTPAEFEAFLLALNTFQPLPQEQRLTPEALLSGSYELQPLLSVVTIPELQQQVFRGACTIAKSKGIDPEEATVLTAMQQAFDISPDLAKTLARQPLLANSATGLLNSALAGMASLIGREGEVRRLIFDYAMGAAIVGLIPVNGGGTLEIKLLVVLVLILKMIWDIRRLWGQPRGQDVLAAIGNVFGFIGAILAGLLAWGTMVGLGVVVPYVDAFAKAAGFATATWITGQATNQFYTSQKRPDFSALKRAFPQLMTSDK